MADVKAKIAEINKTLPEGVFIDTFYDRTELVATTIHTITENISVGVPLVIVMLFLLLGDIAIQASRLPGVSLAASIEMTKAMERTMLEFQQVESVVSKTGRPEITNDPMGVHQTDIFVRLKAADSE